MELPKLEFPLDVVDIKKLIPHRYPFLLIDKVLSLTPDESITAIKSISYSDPILQGHFPGRPIYPGVLMVEGAAQTAGVLGVYSQKGEVEKVFLTSIEDARFRHVVEPGSTVRYEVSIQKRRGQFFWFKSNFFVEEEAAGSVSFSALMQNQ